MDKATDAVIPPGFRDLDGRVVLLDGFVCAPIAATDQLRTFQFVSNFGFGSPHVPPRVQARVFATVTGGRPFLNPGAYTRVPSPAPCTSASAAG